MITIFKPIVLDHIVQKRRNGVSHKKHLFVVFEKKNYFTFTLAILAVRARSAPPCNALLLFIKSRYYTLSMMLMCDTILWYIVWLLDFNCFLLFLLGVLLALAWSNLRNISDIPVFGLLQVKPSILYSIFLNTDCCYRYFLVLCPFLSNVFCMYLSIIFIFIFSPNLNSEVPLLPFLVHRFFAKNFYVLFV